MNAFRPSLPRFFAANNWLWLSSAVILTLGAFMGILCNTELFSNFLNALAGLALLVPLLFVLAAIAAVQWFKRRRVGRWLGSTIVIASVSIASIFIFVAVNSFVERRKNDAVYRYVARAVPILDGIKSQTGYFPSTLPVSLIGEPPEFLKNHGGYKSNGNEFLFEYLDEPAGWAGGPGLQEFESSDRKWKYDR